MIVISNIDTKTLKRGARYPVLKVIEKQVGYIGSNTKKYRIVGDDGACRAYKAEYFREVDDMLDGKFLCVKGDKGWLTKGKVYEFIDDAITYDNGSETDKFETFKQYSNYDRGLCECLKPYKGYLTINELVFENDKRYKVEGALKNVSVYEVSDDELYNVEDGNHICDDYTVKELLEIKFTEVNPNQKRINELKHEIESLKATHEISKNLIEREKEMISVREIELELLL